MAHIVFLYSDDLHGIIYGQSQTQKGSIRGFTEGFNYTISLTIVYSNDYEAFDSNGGLGSNV